MIYQYLKENESVILNKGLVKRYRKNIYSWEKKEKQRQEDLAKWKTKVIPSLLTSKPID